MPSDIGEQHAPAGNLTLAPLPDIQRAVQALVRHPGAQHLASVGIGKRVRRNGNGFVFSHSFIGTLAISKIDSSGRCDSLDAARSIHLSITFGTIKYVPSFVGAL